MKRLPRRKLISLLIMLFLAVGYLTSSDNVSIAPTTIPTPQPTKRIVLGAQQGFYLVVKVIDGDTITVRKDEAEEKVRLIGINTPETVDPRKPVECFGKEASATLKELIMGKEVRLESDETQADRDRYGRLLRYVYVSDNTSINEYMIREGYAYEYTYDVPYVYQQAFKEAEAKARQEQKGLWNSQFCS